MERLYLIIFSVIFIAMLTIPLIAIENNDESFSKVSITKFESSLLASENKILLFVSIEISFTFSESISSTIEKF